MMTWLVLARWHESAHVLQALVKLDASLDAQEFLRDLLSPLCNCRCACGL